MLISGAIEGFPVRIEHRELQLAGTGSFWGGDSSRWSGTGAGAVRMMALEASTPKTLIAVSAGGRFSSRLELAPGKWRGQVGDSFHGKTGDPDFDRAVEVGALDAASLACLGEKARGAILAMSKVGAEVKDGEVRFKTVEEISDPDTIVKTVRAMIEGAQALSAVGASDVPAALAVNAQRDSKAGVRLRNLEMLIKDYRASAETTVAVAAGLHDPDARIRLLAASAAPGDEGTAVVLDLAKHIDGASDALAEDLAEALGRLSDPIVEPTLVKLLARESTEVRVAAALSLGRVGTIKSVEPLLPLTQGVRGQLKEAASAAVRQIQERLGAVEKGRLSVPPTGRL